MAPFDGNVPDLAPPTVVFCITCKGRMQHVAQTLPRNLADNSSYPNTKFVVLDYNSQDGLGQYIQEHHAGDIDSGVVTYYHYPVPDKFHMANAKNMAHRLGMREGGDVLANIDADNFTGRDFSAYVARKFMMARSEGEAIFLRPRENHVGPGRGVGSRMPWGCGGRIIVPTEAFLHAGGYDEAFGTWSPDDLDFCHRLQKLGHVRHGIKPEFLTAIDHGDDLRFKFYERLSDHDTWELFQLRGRQDITIANFGECGKGTVFRNFEPHAIELGRVPTRIFGIGMHKTGTNSLASALQMLKLDAAHWESSAWARNILHEVTGSATGRSHTLERHYALCDFPMAILYKKLDAAYPGSKFILTVRDEDNWLASVKAHWERNVDHWNRERDVHDVHKAVYGEIEFDETLFRNRFRRHNDEVREHFRGRLNDLLEMNMEHGDGWHKLCSFLGRSVPAVRFPSEFAAAELSLKWSGASHNVVSLEPGPEIPGSYSGTDYVMHTADDVP